MTNSDDTAVLDARKNAVFQKVGRNVVNLQRLEARLKFLQSMYVDAPLSKASDAFAQKVKSLAGRTLGPLTHDAVDNLFPEESPQSEFENLTTVVWIRIALEIEGDQASKNNMRAQLKRLVDERNQLIHHMFGGFNPHSAESCSNLGRRLDEQRAHIAEVFQWIEELVQLVSKHIAELHKSPPEIP